MDFTSISTPADLVAKNTETKTPLELAEEALTQCNYDDTKTVILWLVSNMTSFHKERAMECEGEAALMWAKDLGQLVVAYEALKNTL